MSGSTRSRHDVGVRVAVVGERRLIRLGLCRVLDVYGIEATPFAPGDAGAITTDRYDLIVHDGAAPTGTLSAPRDSGMRIIVLIDRDGHASAGDVSVDRFRGVDGIVTAILEPNRPVRRRWVAPSLGPPPLTDREREVLVLLSQGLSAPSVAAALGVSARTVQRHKERIFTKLGAQNQSDAVALALRHGLIDPDGATRR